MKIERMYVLGQFFSGYLENYLFCPVIKFYHPKIFGAKCCFVMYNNTYKDNVY